MRKSIKRALILCLGFVLASILALPVQAEEADVISLSSGYSYNLLVTSDGSLWAWGGNQFGQLGDGTRTIMSSDPSKPWERVVDNDKPHPVKIMDGVAYAVAYYYYSFAIKTDGSLWAWGGGTSDRRYDQVVFLGDGTTQGRSTPVKIMDDVASLTTQGEYSFAVKTDGSLWAWGNNEGGFNLGDGTDENRLVPVKILDDVASIVIGLSSKFAIKTDGSLWAWGYGSALGIEDSIILDEDNSRIIDYNEQKTPVKIMDDVVSVASGVDHSLAVKTDGSLWVWGDNYHGAVGDGTQTTMELHGSIVITDSRLHQERGYYIKNNDRLTPIKIMDGVSSVAAGGFHSLALKTDGSLWAWGNNSYGQVGAGKNDTLILYPAKVLDGVASVASGYRNSFAVKTDGSLWAWGDDFAEQVDESTRTRDINTSDKSYSYYYNTATTPAKILDEVSSVTVERFYTVAFKSDGSLWVNGSISDIGHAAYPFIITNGFE